MKQIIFSLFITLSGISFSQSVEAGNFMFESYYGLFSFDSKKVYDETQYENLTHTTQGTIGFKTEYLVMGEMSSLISGIGYGLEFANSKDEFNYTNTIPGEFFGDPSTIQNVNVKRNSKNIGMVFNNHLFPFFNKLDISLNSSVGAKMETFTYSFTPQSSTNDDYTRKEEINFYLTCMANVKYYVTNNIGLSGAVGYSNFGLVRFGLTLKF